MLLITLKYLLFGKMIQTMLSSQMNYKKMLHYILEYKSS